MVVVMFTKEQIKGFVSSIGTVLKRVSKDYRHLISVAITIGLILLNTFVFPTSWLRIIESFRDFGLSVGFYFCEIFEIQHGIVPTVNALPKVFPQPFLDIASDFEQFKVDWKLYWELWANMDNFKAYWVVVGDVLYYASKVLLIVAPFFILGWLLIKKYFETHNNDYDIDSKQLKVWKKVVDHTITPAKTVIKDYIEFLKVNSYYYKIWLFLVLVSFNLITIVVEFLAFYFYFIVSYDFVGIYFQLYKLIIDLTPMVTFIPIPFWIIISVLVFHNIRKKIGYAVLQHFENRNCGFLNERPIVFMVCGSMGKSKTTTITDLALSQEVMFRDNALQSMIDNDLKFPNFPWCNLENELKRALDFHEIYNLTTIKAFIEKKKARFEKAPTRARIFNYDYERYQLTFDNGLKVLDIWEVLKNYAQEYFIYVMQSSLIISNYAIRTDGIKHDLGNLPLWDNDFFHRKAKEIKDLSRYSHILDFDTLRLGKKVLKENPNADTFEFGVLNITEIGKERGNNLELQEKKKKDEEANQKNDLFNHRLKLIRHTATVDNFCYVRVITDEQRPESWGADARDLCEIVHIREKSETRLVLPFFTIEDILFDWTVSKFSDIYTQYRHVRSDNTLLMYTLKWITAKFYTFQTRIYSTFGYKVISCEVEDGTQDGKLKERKIYISHKKAFPDRFGTDCYFGFFERFLKVCGVGIEDYREYTQTRASIEQLGYQNSYLISDLDKGFVEREKPNKGK